MADQIPYTEKQLKEWAGWRAFRDGKALFERGVVEKVTYEHPLITGFLNLGPRGMRSKFKVLNNGLVDNLCPCRDNQERGLICAHLVAMGLEVLRRNADPVVKEKASAELRRAQRLEKISSEKFILKVKKSDPNAVKARLAVALSENWQEEVLTGSVGIHIHIDADGSRLAA